MTGTDTVPAGERGDLGPIGTSPPRPDGLAKATGAAVFADDLAVAGLWFGATLRSPHPHARIAALRFDPARAPEGAVALTARDLPGFNGVQLIDDEWPILADGVVRHVGEAVAIVAAPTRVAARRALAAFDVEYEPLPAVLTLEAAAAAAAPPLAEVEIACGDVEAALAAAELVVEGSYRTGHQEHIYIECQAMTAWEEDGALVVAGSMQCPYYVHKALVHALGLPPDRARVRATAVGGGFGGKEDYPSLIGLHAALLARAAGRPVRLAYDRHEDIVATTKRHPAEVSHRTGVAGDGTLLALDVEILLDGGAYRTLSPVVLSRAALHASGPYRCAHVRVRGRVLATHTAPNGAFRGFGAPQTQFAMERQMDRVARAAGLDPYEVRARNVAGPGDRLPTGQTLDDSASARLCLEEVERRTGFRERWRRHDAERGRGGVRFGDGAEGRTPARGVGLSLYFHGAGFTGNGERRMRSPVAARLLPDGRIEVLTAMTDMGQGCAAVFPQIAAAAAGVAEEDLVFAEPDTGEVPDSGPTVASRTTMIVGGAIARAVSELRRRVDAWLAAHGEEPGPFRAAAARYVAAGEPAEVVVHHETPEAQRFDEERYQGAAYPTFAWGADVAEVEVDPDTYAVRPLRVTAVCEVGRAIHPRLCAGQVEGGTLQAVGWALLEEVKLEGGRYLNDRLATYIIPTARDAPRIDVHLLERPWEGGPFGAKGMGELPMDGGAPAVAAAVENATGLAVEEVPITPERLFDLDRAGRRERG
ncbi:MAG TPA: xanthine dehydrogenase family protein molybdopterin-binding subunit [Thermoanaerobaculia bacterium]|nr:xanthine dehydrogenase family protein molybdopterin-binding subunit [Thermoanaerobaculia bacterium]